MIDIKYLIRLLKKNNINFFSGVPDSVLKELSIYLQNKSKKNHILAANEGAAVSLGIGHYLSTKKIPCIYMQNSGLSNAINPLISIANQKVYSIPLFLIIGWRGSPRIKDEPQHNVKGKITIDILKLLKIKYVILRQNKDLLKLQEKIKIAKKNNDIIACLIEQGTLKKSKKFKKQKDYYNLDKEFFLETLLQSIEKSKKKTKIISSTGYNSREILYLRHKYKFKKSQDFYMVGGMGHTASVALGYSLSSKKNIICIDGDGSFLMHLGSIKTLGTFANKNMKYFLLNNNSHDSVGGQNTYTNTINIESLAKSLSFQKFYCIKDRVNLRKKIDELFKEKKTTFIEVKISNSKATKLPRPENLIKIKNQFMK
tara:strand:+ start:2013 stop:3122 length:1110 start_codon:yes stop_codon:yes gene_type:complete